MIILRRLRKGTKHPSPGIGWFDERTARSMGGSIIDLSDAEFRAKYSITSSLLDEDAWVYMLEEENEFGVVSP